MKAGITTSAPHVDVEITVITEEAEPATRMETLTVGQDQVTIQCDGGILKEWTVYAGVYTQNGKLIKVVSVQGNGSKTVKLPMVDVGSTDEVRAFVLNADNSPVMALLSSLNKQ